MSRQLPNVVVAADQSRGTTIDFSTRHKKLRDEVFSILAQDRMGLICKYDIDAQQIVFDVVEGVDRTEGQSENSQVILSTSDYASATDYEYKKDQAGYRNFAYVAGQGEGKDRTIETVFEGSSEPTGYLRRELFVDARDVENDGELPDRGAQKLSETTKAVGIKVKFNNNGAFSIDDDFQCGDFVTAKSERSTDDAQVVKVTYQYDGSTGYPTIDLVLDFDPDDIERAISTRLNQYDALLSKETDTSKFLDKSGGTMTGAVEFPPVQRWYENKCAIDLNYSDIIGANAIIFDDVAGITGKEGILFLKSDASPGSQNPEDYDCLKMSDGILYMNDSKIRPIHNVLWSGSWSSGNITVPNSENYVAFVVDFGVGATRALLLRENQYVRGGGHSAEASSVSSFYISATTSGDVWTMLYCYSMGHMPSNSHTAQYSKDIIKIMGIW